MEIRLARTDEAEGLRALVERAFALYIERIGRRPAPMDADYEALAAAGSVWAAVDGGQVAGLVVLELNSDHVFIETIAVDPARQGQGLGRALLEHAERLARERGAGELRLYTNAAMTENLAMYPRLGWHEAGRRRQHGFERVFFVKCLPD